MSNDSTDRKSLALDRVAHRWLKEAADETGMSVKDALQDAILCWKYVIQETKAHPSDLIEDAVEFHTAKERLEEISRAIEHHDEEMDLRSEFERAVDLGPVPKMEEGLQADAADRPDSDYAEDLYTTDWERTKNTTAKVGPGSYRVVKKLSEETGRSAKACVEEAVQLWCIVQTEHRGERARRKLRRIRDLIENS